jgi:hypothetical protein
MLRNKNEMFLDNQRRSIFTIDSDDFGIFEFKCDKNEEFKCAINKARIPTIFAVPRNPRSSRRRARNLTSQDPKATWIIVILI